MRLSNHSINNRGLNLNIKKEVKAEDKKPVMFRDKKKSLEIHRPRMSKSSNKYETGKRLSINGSYITYNDKNKLNYSYFGINKSNCESEVDYKGIEQEIKYTILEMKNNYLMENKRQSLDELELEFNKNNKLNKVLDEEMINSQIFKNDELNKDIKNKKKKLRKSNTNVGKNKINFKGKILNKKKNSCKNNINNIQKSINNSSFNKDNKINEKPRTSTNSLLIKNIKKGDRKSLALERFRFYRKGGVIEDSYNESESDEEVEPDSFLINPETTPFLIYDTIIALASIYSLIFIPYEITDDCFCDESHGIFKLYINFFLDILFLFDFIINFSLEYYSESEKLIKIRKKIINHYLKGWFFFDLLASLPMNILYHYYCKNYPNLICHTYERNKYVYYLILLKSLKTIKIFKMPGSKNNQFIRQIYELSSDNTTETIDLIFELLLVIFGLHIISCIHIFIGKHTYPGWIYANDFQNYSLSNLYMISVYYLITTMTTVGYGDISSDSFIEIVFRIILLAVGIIIYSWLISSISNGINKQSYASMNYSNECLILENIRIEHADLPFEVYNEIKKHLEYKHFHQQIYDKNLLINSLPYSLKNNLIFSMYKIEIERFGFFKGISNTNFLSEVLYNFSPLICKKNEILLKENEIIEEIFFVREGRLSLEIPINMDEPEDAANEYLSRKFMNFAFNFDENDNFNNLSKIMESNISNHSITSLLEERRKSFGFSMLGDKDFNIRKNKNPKIFYLKIYDVHKNEDYGGLYIYHGKRSPFSVKVKTKRVKLYIIKKDDFSNICETYKNVIKRIQKKEKKNIFYIKNILIKTIDRFCHSNGVNIKEEYKADIEKAIKELNKNILPDILKQNKEFQSTFENEIDEEINKTINEFKISVIKLSTLNAQLLTKTRARPNQKKKVNKVNRISLNSLKLRRNSSMINNIRSPKKSFNFAFRGNFGAGIIQSFKPSYYDDSYITKDSNSLNMAGMNDIIQKKILDKKKRLSLQIKIRENEKDLNINELKEDENHEIRHIDKKEEKVKEIIPIVKTNDENDTLKDIDFDYSENEKDSHKTIKIKEKENHNEKESIDTGPSTIKDLPQSLQSLLKFKINNHKINNKIYNKFKIDHIYIEINNNKNNIDKKDNINSNTFNDITNINTTNNLTNLISNENSKTDNIIINDEIKNNKYKKTESYNNIKLQSKNTSPKNSITNKFNKSKSKNYLIKNKEKISKLKKKSTNHSSAKINLNSFNSPNLLPKMTNNYYKKISSVTNNNIWEKFDEVSLNKNNNSTLENLSSTSADSFEIKRSYKNLNQASGGIYIKNKKLQIKTIKFVKEYDNCKNNKKKKEKNLISRLADNFDIQNLMKNNKDEDNQFKKIENTLKKGKTKMNNILKKKKKMQEINNNTNNINNKCRLKMNLSHSPSPKDKIKKKLYKNQLTLNSISEYNDVNLSSSNLQLNSFVMNHDDTLSKLNCSNNEISKEDILDESKLKSEKKLFKLDQKRSLNLDNKK